MENLEQKISQLATVCKNCGQCNLSMDEHFYGLINPLGVLRDVQASGPETAILHQPLFNSLISNLSMIDCPTNLEQKGMDFALLIRYLRQYAYEHKISVKGKTEQPGHCAVPYTSVENIPKTGYDMQLYFKYSPELKIAKTGEIAYFIGDIPLYEAKQSKGFFDYYQIPPAVVKILNQVGIKPVVLNTLGSGFDDLWAGYSDVFTKVAQYNTNIFTKANIKTIIVEDAEAYHTLKFEYPQVCPEFNFEVVQLSDYLARQNLIKKLRFDSPIECSYVYHDSPFMGRLGDGIYHAPRKVLSKLQKTLEIPLEENHEYCHPSGAGMYMDETDESVKIMWVELFSKVLEGHGDYIVSSSIRDLTHWAYVEQEVLSIDQKNNVPPMKEWAVFLSRFLQ